eukprot:GHVT01101647.1.p2 GENE.GHVT01101647.1~~GHVT01101647.1.p2  ORF type:complete len:327 (-),score=46.34 GHVT01101647.1:4289-5269(-)
MALGEEADAVVSQTGTAVSPANATAAEAVRVEAVVADVPAVASAWTDLPNRLEALPMKDLDPFYMPLLTFSQAISSKHYLKRLRVICLTANDLESFPSFACRHSSPNGLDLIELPALERLLLNHNRITSFEIAAADNIALEKFEQNRPGCPPLCFLQVCAPSLRVLDLRNNSAESPAGLKVLLHDHPTLERLSLSCTHVGRAGGKFTPAALEAVLPRLSALRTLGLFDTAIDMDARRPLQGDVPAIQTLPELKESGQHSLRLEDQRGRAEATAKALFSVLASLYPNLQHLYVVGNLAVDCVKSRRRLFDLAAQAMPKLISVDGVVL